MSSPPSPPEAVKAAFTAHAKQITGIKTAYDHEPEKFGPKNLPAVTMLTRAFPQEDKETGESTDVTWTFRVNLYISTNERFRKAQTELDELGPQLLAITRRDFSLGDTCEKAELTDPGRDPFFDGVNHYVVKELVLTALTREF